MRVKAPFYIHAFRATPDHDAGFRVSALQGHLYIVVLEWYDRLARFCM